MPVSDSCRRGCTRYCHLIRGIIGQDETAENAINLIESNWLNAVMTIKNRMKSIRCGEQYFFHPQDSLPFGNR